MKRLVIPCVGLALLASDAAAPGLDLIRDGQAVSTIAVPGQASELEKQGAETLAKYLKLASGAELPVVPESPGLQGTLISVGKTELARAAGITDQGLKYDGYRISVKGGSLFLLGRDTDIIDNYSGARGSLRVVFGLLDRLEFRWLQPTPMGTYVPESKTVAVPDDLDVTYEPPFMYVHGRFVNQGDWSLANSFRCAAKLFSAGGHTWVYGVPAQLYDTHPARQSQLECSTGGVRNGILRSEVEVYPNESEDQRIRPCPTFVDSLIRWDADVLNGEMPK
jgi:hypothetical protein